MSLCVPSFVDACGRKAGSLESDMSVSVWSGLFEGLCQALSGGVRMDFGGGPLARFGLGTGTVDEVFLSVGVKRTEECSVDRACFEADRREDSLVDGVGGTFEFLGGLIRVAGERIKGEGLRLVFEPDFGVVTRYHGRSSTSASIRMAWVRSFCHVVFVVLRSRKDGSICSRWGWATSMAQFWSLIGVSSLRSI